MKKFEICSITAPGFWSLALLTPTLGAPNGCFEPNIFLMALSRDSRLILLPWVTLKSPGLDYTDTFSLIIKAIIVCVVLSLTN